MLSSGVSTKITDDIIACSNNEEGIQLHHEMGVKTDALNPSHSYVPWVTFNGVSSVHYLIRNFIVFHLNYLFKLLFHFKDIKFFILFNSTGTWCQFLLPRWVVYLSLLLLSSRCSRMRSKEDRTFICWSLLKRIYFLFKFKNHF